MSAGFAMFIGIGCGFVAGLILGLWIGLGIVVSDVEGEL